MVHCVYELSGKQSPLAVTIVCIASHCYVMSLLCLCAFVRLNKRLLTYLLT